MQTGILMNLVEMTATAGFHVSRLLQLLTSYVTSEFDVLVKQAGPNQLKVR